MKGKILGVVPYSFERPTLQRLRETMWNPDRDEIVVPQAFGVGWTLNLAALKRRYPPAFWGLVALFVWRVLRRFRRAVR